MNQIDNLSNDASQQTTIVLPDGSTATIQIKYLPTVQRWTLGVTYGDFSVVGINICIHPNLLRVWINILPFGITCTTIDGVDPIYIDDFSSGRAALYVLTESEVLDFEDSIMGASA